MTGIYGKGDRGKATYLHAKLVRDRDICEARDWPIWPTPHGCAGRLECAHIISRRYANTRTDLDNAICLCSSAHRYFTANPLDFAAFVEWWARHTGRITRADGLGSVPVGDYGTELRRRRDASDKINWRDELARLQALTKDL